MSPLSKIPTFIFKYVQCDFQAPIIDPVTAVGFAASIAQLIDLSLKGIEYLKDVKDAPKDRAKLAIEATSLLGLLISLKDRAQDANTSDPWFRGVISLGAPHGPLEQYKEAMEELIRESGLTSSHKEALRRLTWTHDKKQIEATLNKIERFKTQVSLALQGDNLTLSLAISDEVNGVKNDIRLIEQNRKAQKAITWLSKLNFSAKQRDCFSRWLKGTGQWLINAKEFKTWLGGGNWTLWCPGIAGAGKTILSSMVVNHLEVSFQQQDVAVAYIYFDYKEHGNESATNFIASLLQQLLWRQITISDHITKMYNDHKSRGTQPSISELSRALLLAIQSFSEVFIIIDALDECPEVARDDLLHEIRGLSSKTRLMVTSPQNTVIEREFEGALRLEIYANEQDIKFYLQARINQERQLGYLIKEDKALRETVVCTLTDNAKGMFLMPQLHLNSLAKMSTKKNVRQALQNLPQKILATYDEAMKRIQSQNEEHALLAHKVLSWISHVRKPLSVKTLQCALAVEPGTTELDEEALPIEDLLVSVCAGLVIIDRESCIVRLIHHTTQNYFEHLRLQYFPGTQAMISTTCLTYLSYDVFGSACSLENFHRVLQDNPLLGYAARHWGYHFAEIHESSITELVLDFFEKEHKMAYQIMYPTMGLFLRYDRFSVADAPGLQIASYFGLKAIAELLLEKGRDVEATGSDGSTALMAASWNGQTVMVRLLLEHGANIQSRNKDGWTALAVATSMNHTAAMSLLLDRGADLETRRSVGFTPLMEAVFGYNTAVASLLLKRGAEVNVTCDRESVSKLGSHHTPENQQTQITDWAATRRASWEGSSTGTTLKEEGLISGVLHERTDEPYRTLDDVAVGEKHELKIPLSPGMESITRGLTPLHMAVNNGMMSTTQLLLENGAIVDAKAGMELTALHMAVTKSSESMILLLVKNGADINANTVSGLRGLHIAVSLESKSRTLLLLKNGADINAKDVYGRTALLTAAGKGFESMLLLLLQNGADIRARDANGRTALHLIVLSVTTGPTGLDSLMQLLLKNGADIDAKDNSGLTALHLIVLSVTTGLDSLMQLLLKNGADINAKDNNELTALHMAMWQNSESIVLLLLQNGADIRARDAYGRTALHLIVLSVTTGPTGLDSLMQLLLKNGADIDAKDNSGLTAPHLIVLSVTTGPTGLDSLMQPLLKNGADIDAKDNSRLTAPHLIVLRITTRPTGLNSLMQPLLKNGADIDAKDNSELTALHMAMWQNSESIVLLLLQNGADIRARDANGQTALHCTIHRIKAECDKWNGQKAQQQTVLREAKATILLLLKNGANINAKSRDRHGHTVLHITVLIISEGRDSLILFLQNNGADINARNKLEYTPLHLAIQTREADGRDISIKLLLDNGAEINAKAKWGITALHLAVVQATDGLDTLIPLLLENGAEINAKAKWGITALHLAVVQATDGLDTLIPLLLENGADINAKAKWGITALDAAKVFSNAVAIKLLEDAADINVSSTSKTTASSNPTYTSSLSAQPGSTETEHIEDAVGELSLGKHDS